MYSPLDSGPTVYPENTVGNGRNFLYLGSVSTTWHNVQSKDRQSDRRVTCQISILIIEIAASARSTQKRARTAAAFAKCSCSPPLPPTVASYAGRFVVHRNGGKHPQGSCQHCCISLPPPRRGGVVDRRVQQNVDGRCGGWSVGAVVAAACTQAPLRAAQIAVYILNNETVRLSGHKKNPALYS